MNKHEEALMYAFDIVKDNKRCRECVGNCIECEYGKARDQIEDAIHDYCKLLKD